LVIAMMLVVCCAKAVGAWPDSPPPSVPIVPPPPSYYPPYKVGSEMAVPFSGNPADLIDYWDEGWTATSAYGTTSGATAYLRYVGRPNVPKAGTVLILPAGAMGIVRPVPQPQWPCCHEASWWDRMLGRCKACL